MDKKYTVIIKEEFHKEFQSIMEYTTYFFGYNQTEKLTNAVLKQINTLEQNPNIYLKIEGKNNYRYFTLIKYPFHIIFRINEKEKVVYVLKIVHVSRNDKFKI